MITETKAEDLKKIRSYWEKQIKGWKESGLSQSAYCREHNLIPHRFTYWKQKLVKSPDAQVALVEVHMKTGSNHSPTYSSPLRLVFNNQFHIEIDRGFDPATLRLLIHVLQRI